MRPLRRSPLYDRLQAKGAVFGTKLNWERANYFLPRGRAARALHARYAASGCRTCSKSSARAARTSSCSTRRRSRNSCSRGATRSRCCSGCAPTRSTSRSAGWCTPRCSMQRGGFESDLTITRLAARHVLHPDRLRAGDARRRRGSSATSREGEFAALVDVTSAYSVISLMGPKSEALLRTLGPDDLSKAGLPFSMTAEIDVGHARVRAARMSYVGGPGYEMVVPTDQCVTLYDALVDRGRGVRPAATPATTRSTRCASRQAAARGARSCRRTRRRWKPGSAYAVKLDKPAPFIGREALLRAARGRRAQAPRACSRSTIPPRFPGAASPS